MKAADANDILRARGPDGLRSAVDATPAEPLPPRRELLPRGNGRALPTRKLRYTLFDDIDPQPKKVFLVERLLGAGETSSFFGRPGSGKSVLAGDMACHIAAGMPWLGRRVNKGAVLYVAAERARLVERRLAAFRKYHQRYNLPLALVAGTVDLMSNCEHVEEIATRANELTSRFSLSVVLIVVDTVSRVLNGGDENSPKDMGALIAYAAHLQEVTGAHILLIHHVPQDGNIRLRGHGALLGSLDTVVAIEKSGATRTATVTKENDGIEDQLFAFDLKSVSLSIDPDTLEETSAPVVLPVQDTLGRCAVRSIRLTAAAQIALRALHQAIDECGAIPAPSNTVPANIKAVTIEQWRAHAYRTGISTSDKANAKRTAFSRASEALIAAGKIRIWEPHVWPAS